MNLKYIGIGLIAIGSLGIYLGGGSEGFAVEVVAGVFTIIGIVVGILKKETK